MGQLERRIVEHDPGLHPHVGRVVGVLFDGAAHQVEGLPHSEDVAGALLCPDDPSHRQQVVREVVKQRRPAGVEPSAGPGFGCALAWAVKSEARPRRLNRGDRRRRILLDDRAEVAQAFANGARAERDGESIAPLRPVPENGPIPGCKLLLVEEAVLRAGLCALVAVKPAATNLHGTRVRH